MIRDIFLAIVLWSVLTPPLSAQTRAEIRDRVFVTAQRAQASAAGQALAQAAGRIAAGTAGLEALLREQQDISKAISDQRTALAKLAAQPGAEAELSVSRLQSQIARGRDKLAALDVELMADFPEFRELTNPAPLSIAEVNDVRTTSAPGSQFIDMLFSESNLVGNSALIKSDRLEKDIVLSTIS